MLDKVQLKVEDYIDPDNGSFIVATGTYKSYEHFRVVYMIYKDDRDDEVRIEIREMDNCLGDQVWLTIPKYTNRLHSSALDLNPADVFTLRQDVYRHLLHELLEIYYGELKYPFEIYKKNYMGAWRLICVGPNQFKWDDVVENNMGEKVFVARDDPCGSETTNLESACLFFLKKIMEHAQKVVDTSA